MNASTLALVEIGNSEEVFAAYGHASLEAFLGEFTSRIEQFARATDEILQIQPNKFCVLLDDVTDPVKIELAGAKLTRLFETPIRISDEELRAVVHAAFVPPGDRDTKMRLRIAESGLLEARRHHRPFVILDAIEQSLTVGAKRIREIELALEQGEFAMHFQPQIRSGSRMVTGAEGLMRWHHPTLGIRPPSDFIPYATNGTIMRALTWFSIKACVCEAALWPDTSSVAVNVSPRLLHDETLCPNVEDALSIFDLPAHRLTLEITEDAMLERPDITFATLHRLRELGVRISIDDFGTGFSSLAYFRELPIDELKIDRSFVSQMLERPRDRDLVKAIIDLAHNLGMTVVAEGVEDAATAEALEHLGAEFQQGYWFGKPMESSAFQRLLEFPVH